MNSTKSKYQKYIVETVHRSEIKNAEYNPRIIDTEAKKKLKENLEKHGLIEPIVWNRKTGNLVGGHQRLEALDTLEGSKDYTLDVSVISVDERDEAILNVQLNNPSMQGTWDLDKLADMNLDFGIDFEEMGFDQFDIDFMFDGDDRFSQLFETPEAEATKNTLSEIKEARENMNERMDERGNLNWYTMIVFKDEEEKKEFYKKIHVPIYEEIIRADVIDRIKNDGK